MKFVISIFAIVITGSLLLLHYGVTLPTSQGPGKLMLAMPAEAPDEALLARIMLDQVNALRAEGCRCPDKIYYKPAPSLTWNDKLTKAARRHAEDMAKKKYFSHMSKDGSNFTDRVSKAGYNWQTVAENIAYGYTQPEDVVLAWKQSNGHCQNMMNPNFNEMGGARQGRYWVQELGAPMPKRRP